MYGGPWPPSCLWGSPAFCADLDAVGAQRRPSGTRRRRGQGKNAGTRFFCKKPVPGSSGKNFYNCWRWITVSCKQLVGRRHPSCCRGDRRSPFCIGRAVGWLRSRWVVGARTLRIVKGFRDDPTNTGRPSVMDRQDGSRTIRPAGVPVATGSMEIATSLCF